MALPKPPGLSCLSLPVYDLTVGPATADLHPDALLAEPPERSPEWIVSTYARVACASHGLVALGGPSTQPDAPWSRRLVAAGAPFAASPSSVDTARATHYPALSRVLDVNWGRGSPAPALVLVGDRDPRDTSWPLLSRSGVWLFRALRELGHDELTVYACNAFGPDGSPARDTLLALAAAFAPHGQPTATPILPPSANSSPRSREQRHHESSDRFVYRADRGRSLSLPVCCCL